MLDQPLKVLILSSSTGGGHDMRARSLTQWADAHTAWQVSTHQALEQTHALYRFGVHVYNAIQRYQPSLHHGYFSALELARLHRNADAILGAARFTELVRKRRPQVVVSTHAHLNHGFFALARAAIDPPPACITYCGELSGGYGFSRHWVNPDADAFIAAVETTRHAAVGLGMRESAAFTGGFLLDPRFYGSRPEPVHAELGLDPARFTLLLSASARGANNHARVLRAIATMREAPQVIALCGRNEALRAQLESIASRHADLPLRALEFSREMPSLLRTANAVFARPGTGTTSEALQSGCPILFNRLGGAMPQERITLLYARQQQFGAVIRDARTLPEVLDEWMQDPATIDEQKQFMRAALPSQHPLDILRHVARLGLADRSVKPPDA